jgi:hypothetical protein
VKDWQWRVVRSIEDRRRRDGSHQGRPPIQRRVEIAARDLDPAAITDYLRELRPITRRIWQPGRLRRVIHEDEGIRRAKLAASSALQRVMRNGLRLLGVTPRPDVTKYKVPEPRTRRKAGKAHPSLSPRPGRGPGRTSGLQLLFLIPVSWYLALPCTGAGLTPNRPHGFLPPNCPV